MHGIRALHFEKSTSNVQGHYSIQNNHTNPHLFTTDIHTVELSRNSLYEVLQRVNRKKKLHQTIPLCVKSSKFPTNTKITKSHIK